MSNLSQFGGGSAPVGSIIQAPYNIVDTAWLPCDGRKVVRATYPVLSTCLPSVGTFTATARTKPNTSYYFGAICSDGTNFIMSGLSGGTGGIITTPDGINFTQRTTPASASIVSLISDGTNIVGMTNSTSNTPIYSSNGGVTWTATASSLYSLSGMPSAMTYASTLGTVGRYLMANSGSGATQIATSDDRGVTWTLRNHGLAYQIMQVCWTGVKFIGTLNVAGFIAVSADGIVWTLQAMPFSTTATANNAGSIVSDGAGKVLWIDGNGTGIITSIDHGVTWSKRVFGAIVSLYSIGGTVGLSIANYSNGRFIMIVGPNSGLSFLCSADLQGWVMVPDAGIVNGNNCVAYKAGVYFMNSGGTSPNTLVEDTTKLYLPSGSQNEVSGNSINGSSNNFLPFIKVQ